MSTTPPCRLYGLMAREAPRAVLFRRGPGNQVRLILWHTDTDQFERGQWLKGRIQERSADLAPNGDKVIYYAHRYHGNHVGERWITISRPPFLSALACWRLPNYVGYAAGHFESNDSVYVAIPESRQQLISGSMPASIRFRFIEDRAPAQAVVPWITYDGSIVRDRLDRNGWHIIQPAERQSIMKRFEIPDLSSFKTFLDDKQIEDIRVAFQDMAAAFPTGEYPIGFHTTRPEIRVKCGNSACAELTRTWTGSESSDRFAIVSRGSPSSPFTVADWADIDQAGRAVFARDGCAYALTVGPDGSPTERLLADFNDDRFEPIEAPEWATRW